MEHKTKPLSAQTISESRTNEMDMPVQDTASPLSMSLGHGKPSPNTIIQLQRLYGNQRVIQMMRQTPNHTHIQRMGGGGAQNFDFMDMILTLFVLRLFAGLIGMIGYNAYQRLTRQTVTTLSQNSGVQQIVAQVYEDNENDNDDTVEDLDTTSVKNLAEQEGNNQVSELQMSERQLPNNSITPLSSTAQTIDTDENIGEDSIVENNTGENTPVENEGKSNLSDNETNEKTPTKKKKVRGLSKRKKKYLKNLKKNQSVSTSQSTNNTLVETIEDQNILEEDDTLEQENNQNPNTTLTGETQNQIVSSGEGNSDQISLISIVENTSNQSTSTPQNDQRDNQVEENITIENNTPEITESYEMDEETRKYIEALEEYKKKNQKEKKKGKSKSNNNNESSSEDEKEPDIFDLGNDHVFSIVNVKAENLKDFAIKHAKGIGDSQSIQQAAAKVVNSQGTGGSKTYKGLTIYHASRKNGCTFFYVISPDSLYVRIIGIGVHETSNTYNMKYVDSSWDIVYEKNETSPYIFKL